MTSLQFDKKQLNEEQPDEKQLNRPEGRLQQSLAVCLHDMPAACPDPCTYASEAARSSSEELLNHNVEQQPKQGIFMDGMHAHT